MTSATASGAPLFGTWTVSIAAAALNFSPPMCVELPSPADANVSLPGFALAASTSAWTVSYPRDGDVTRIFGVLARVATGVKSLMGSHGGLVVTGTRVSADVYTLIVCPSGSAFAT